MSKLLGIHTATLPLKNIVINGDMFVDQRYSGAAISAANTDNAYLVDRWLTGNSQNGKFNSGQNQLGFTPPNGFSKYLNMNCVSTVSLVAGDYFFLQQRIEGINIMNLAWGTNSAKNITLSFWVRCSTAGTFGGSVGNASSTRSYPFTYTINAINTFEYKTVTIPGDTTGTWLTTTGIGIILYFGLGVGATLSGTAGAWAGGNFVSATGATSVVTSGQNWNLTGVQVTEGSQAVDFRLFGGDPKGEKSACERYAERCFSSGGKVSVAGSSGSAQLLYLFRTEKRAVPTPSAFSTLRLTDVTVNDYVATSPTFADSGSGILSARININTVANWSPALPAIGTSVEHYGQNDVLLFIAEL